MIKIQVQNNRKSADHFLSEITDSIMDESLKSTKEHLETEFRNTECDVHKSKSKGIITIKSNNNKTEFEYSDFCCDEFKEKFKK